MLTLLAAVFFTQDSTRIRDLLPNGSAVIVENMPGSAVSIQLFASSRGAGETATTHGWRHLLEHLLLKGRKEATSIDERAESNGIFITGRTYRDAMQIEITCKADQIEMGLAFLDELLLPIDLTQETIDKEIAVMRQEIVLEDDAAKLARGAWKTAYGETGIDSLGDPLVMAKATPDELAELQARHFAPANLGLVISGPVSLEKVAEKAKQCLQKVRGTAGVAVTRVESEAQRLDMPDAFGELRGARVSGIRESKTGAALISAFAIASDLPGTFVTYTPSTNLGLVMVGRSESNSGLGFFIDELEDDRKAALFARGRTLALRWAERYKNSPTSISYWRGMLMCQDQSLRPETVVQAISQVTYAQYLEALGGFSKEKAIIVVGDRK